MIKSLLGRSSLIRSIYANSQKRYAKIYRHRKSSNRSGEYNELIKSTDYNLRNDFINEDMPTIGNRITPHPQADNPVLTRDDIDDAIAQFVADPFVVYSRGIYDMFFEIKDMAGEVYIGHAFSENGVEYEYNQVVIEPEVAHHTYPYVFRYEDNWVMVPSPGSNVKGEFRVYVADEYPTEWRVAAIPIAERVRQDPTPILWDDVWYIIYQDTESLDIILKYSDTLTNPGWREHPKSPIFRNNANKLQKCSIGSAEMVPSGRPIYRKDGIDIFYRSHMNKEVYHYQITELSKNKFKQSKRSNEPIFERQKQEQWNGRFMHTINPVYPWNETNNIVAVDGLERDRYIYSIGIYSLN